MRRSLALGTNDEHPMSRHSWRTLRWSSWPRALVLVLAAFALAGCATTHPMMPAPALYTGPQARPLFTHANARRPGRPRSICCSSPTALRRRAADEPEPYTADRSRSMAFGSTTILFGEGVTWDTLVKQSLAAERTDLAGPHARADAGARPIPAHPVRGHRDRVDSVAYACRRRCARSGRAGACRPRSRVAWPRARARRSCCTCTATTTRSRMPR